MRRRADEICGGGYLTATEEVARPQRWSKRKAGVMGGRGLLGSGGEGRSSAEARVGSGRDGG